MFTNTRKRIICIITSVFLAVLMCIPCFAYTAREISELCSAAVFYILVDTPEGIAQGSGFFIDGSGVAVTNFHVIEGGRSAAIKLIDGYQYDVDKVLYYSRKDDIAVIKVSRTSKNGVYRATDFATLPMLPMSQVHNGDVIYAIGSPEGYSNTISNGIVSNAKRYNETKDTYEIQITAPISHGSSGGAVINEDGYVIGVSTSGYLEGAQNINFAVPLDSILYFNPLTPGIPFSELTSYTSNGGIDAEPAFCDNMWSESGNVSNGIETTIIESGDTISSYFTERNTSDYFKFTLDKPCKFESIIFVGEYANTTEWDILSSLVAGVLTDSGDIVGMYEYLDMGDYIAYALYTELPAGKYKALVFPMDGYERSWANREYLYYARWGEEAVDTPIPQLPATNIPGSPVGEALYTDIRAYINGYPVRSFNIKGNTAIVAEDLAKYGFNVRYDNATRTLHINPTPSAAYFKPPAFIEVPVGGTIGAKAYDVVSTDIATYFGTKKLNCFSINGEMLIYIDDIASAGVLTWNGAEREIELSILGLPFAW